VYHTITPVSIPKEKLLEALGSAASLTSPDLLTGLLFNIVPFVLSHFDTFDYAFADQL
jgi:hypothetical protein